MKNNADAQNARNSHSIDVPESKPLTGAFTQLLPKIRHAIADNGYTSPTPIQEQCIPKLLEGRDMLGSAQTGTGKTAAFTLPMLQQMTKNPRGPRRGIPRALIIAPTRELADQIGASIETYGKYLKITHTVIYGGVGQHRQVKALNRGVDILVATPGRLLDLMQQRYIRLDEVEFFVLDEVDRMLDMGFIPDIKRVIAKLSKDRQTLFFSATMAPKMVELASTMVRNPARVTIAPDKPAVERIEQRVLFVGRRNKDALLVSLLDNPRITKAIVFIQMKHAANKVVKKLDQAGIRGTSIHGNKSQAARTKALDGFKRGQFRVLVATDVAARGLDVDDITHVINYDLPKEAETYVHRIGRTARAGADGDAISFCSRDDRGQLRDIERLLGKAVPAEIEHDFHCDETFRSVDSAPSNRGNNSNRNNNRSQKPNRGPKPQGKQRHFRGRGQRRPNRASA